jgi:hypothetical protein
LRGDNSLRAVSLTEDVVAGDAYGSILPVRVDSSLRVAHFPRLEDRSPGLSWHRAGQNLSPKKIRQRFQFVPTPSIVVTDLPLTTLIGVTHERVAAPSMCTVHAPQSASRNRTW